jgi:diguanylate cyclase (GGDEF)-like protein
MRVRLADAPCQITTSHRETSLDAIAICRMDDGMFVDVNSQFFSILGYDRKELVGQTSEELYTWTDSEGKNHRGEFFDVSGRSSHELKIWENPRDWERLTAALRKESVCRSLEVRLRKKNGDLIWAVVSASVIELDDVPCVLFVTRDISAAKAAEEEIRNLSLYDGLTCLSNRRQLLERLRACCNARAERRQSALLSINLDHFRAVNESCGSALGDLLLQVSARRIVSCVRDGDTVARSSGDEFSVILVNLSIATEEAAAKARIIAQRILTTLEEPFSLEGRDCRCTASIGITIFDTLGPATERHCCRSCQRGRTQYDAILCSRPPGCDQRAQHHRSGSAGGYRERSAHALLSASGAWPPAGGR